MSFWRRFLKSWSSFGHFIGDIVGRVVLSLFYFTVMLPFSLGVTLFGDPLKIKRKTSAHWQTREKTSAGIEQARRMS